MGCISAKILVDNRTNDPALETEHGLSILLKTEKHRILLDTGASDMLIRNAEKLGIDLGTGDSVFKTLQSVMADQIHAFSCGTTINI